MEAITDWEIYGIRQSFTPPGYKWKGQRLHFTRYAVNRAGQVIGEGHDHEEMMTDIQRRKNGKPNH